MKYASTPIKQAQLTPQTQDNTESNPLCMYLWPAVTALFHRKKKKRKEDQAPLLVT